MSIKDPHDRRTFQHFVKLADDGTVAAIVEYADGSLVHSDEHPVDAAGSVYINVTELVPVDFTGVQVTTPVTHANRSALRAELARRNKGRRGG
jgi:hypothetical protein